MIWVMVLKEAMIPVRSSSTPDPLHEGDGGEDGEEGEQGVGEGPAPGLDEGAPPRRLEPVHEREDDEDDEGGHPEEPSDLTPGVTAVLEEQGEAEGYDLQAFGGGYGPQGVRHHRVVLDGLVERLLLEPYRHLGEYQYQTRLGRGCGRVPVLADQRGELWVGLRTRGGLDVQVLDVLIGGYEGAVLFGHVDCRVEVAEGRAPSGNG